MSEQLTQAVKDKYGAVAASGLSTDQEGVRAVAEAFGYSSEELQAIPAAANMGLSCGNPTAMASLKPGEVVVDLGCGGGLDVFLAARKVGPTGRAIGIDMTEEMIALARKNALAADGGQPIRNVEFHLAAIERMPIADAVADCVISNCVINLVPDKPAAFREIWRILKPGGRLAVSDIALKRPLPADLARDVAAYVGCVAGAIPIDEYRRQLLVAGFAHVEIIDSGADLNAYAKVENQAGCCTPSMAESASNAAPSCCGPAKPASAGSGCCGGENQLTSFHDQLLGLLQKYDVNDYAASVKVFAVKPATA
jgi:SAM-dependent methyltransferase